MTPWWGTLLAALAGGLIAVAGAILNGSFDRRRARGEEWFRRLQWAQQLTASGSDADRAAGFDSSARSANPDWPATTICSCSTS